MSPAVDYFRLDTDALGYDESERKPCLAIIENMTSGHILRGVITVDSETYELMANAFYEAIGASSPNLAEGEKGYRRCQFSLGMDCGIQAMQWSSDLIKAGRWEDRVQCMDKTLSIGENSYNPPVCSLEKFNLQLKTAIIRYFISVTSGRKMRPNQRRQGCRNSASD
jgi:hypothetical protein